MVADENSPQKYYGEQSDVWGCANDNCNRSSRLPQIEIKVLDEKQQIMWVRFGDETVYFPMCNHCGKSLSIIYSKHGDKYSALTSASDQIGMMM